MSRTSEYICIKNTLDHYDDTIHFNIHDHEPVIIYILNNLLNHIIY